MSRRELHVKKSDEEYQEYLDSNIRVSGTSRTVPDMETDATNRSVPQEEVTYRESAAPARRAASFLDHWHSIWPSIIVIVIAGVLGWCGATLIRLNRESGMATANFAAVKREQTTLAESIRHVEDRLGKELDALTLRVDRIVDTRIPNPESGGSK